MFFCMGVLLNPRVYLRCIGVGAGGALQHVTLVLAKVTKAIAHKHQSVQDHFMAGGANSL